MIAFFGLRQSTIWYPLSLIRFMVFTHKNSQPTIGFIGTSVGSSPFSTAALFWLQPLLWYKISRTK
jgi:hypothetical protein